MVKHTSESRFDPNPEHISEAIECPLPVESTTRTPKNPRKHDTSTTIGMLTAAPHRGVPVLLCYGLISFCTCHTCSCGLQRARDLRILPYIFVYFRGVLWCSCPTMQRQTAAVHETALECRQSLQSCPAPSTAAAQRCFCSGGSRRAVEAVDCRARDGADNSL